MLFRRSELLILGYFAYATAVSFWLPVDGSVRCRTVIVNIAIAIALYVLARWDLSHARDWFAIPMMLLSYREMGWFATPHADTHLEESWVVIDRIVLNHWGGRALIESLGPVIPFVLELSYLLVYTIGTFCLIVVYAKQRREQLEALMFPLLLGTFASYMLFPFFPSEPPRTVWPAEDLPSYRPVLRQFTYWLLGNWGIHTSVFPSAHVSSAFAAAFGMLRLTGDLPWLRRGLFVLATLIAIATVYGRYHFLVDAVAGFAIAVLAWRMGIRVGRASASTTTSVVA